MKEELFKNVLILTDVIDEEENLYEKITMVNINGEIVILDDLVLIEDGEHFLNYNVVEKYVVKN